MCLILGALLKVYADAPLALFFTEKDRLTQNMSAFINSQAWSSESGIGFKRLLTSARDSGGHAAVRRPAAGKAVSPLPAA